MKLGYLIPRMVLGLIIWGFLTFGFDPMLRWSLQWAGKMSLNRDVRIAAVETKFFPPRFEATKSQLPSLTRQDVDLLTAEQLIFALDGEALLRKSFIVEEGTVLGLHLAPEADTTDKTKPKSQQTDWSQTLEPWKQASKQWTEQMLARAENQYDLQRLETVRLSQQLEADYKAQFAHYKQVAKTLHDRLNELKAIAKDKSGSAFDRLDRYRQIPAEVQQLTAEAKRLKDQLQRLPSQAQLDYQSLLQAKDHDLAIAKSELISLTPGGEAFTQLILGPDTREYIGQLQQWYATAMQWKAALFPELKPSRSAGVDIPFLVKAPLPNVWLKKLSLSGLMQHENQMIPFTGFVTGVTDNPRLIDEPIKISLTGDYNGGYELKGLIDLRQSPPIVEWTAEFEPSEKLAQTLINDDRLKMGLRSQKRTAKIQCRLVGQTIDATIDLKHSDVQFDVEGQTIQLASFSSLDNKHIGQTLQQGLTNSLSDMQPISLLDDILSGVSSIEGQLKLSGEITRPKLNVETNLGDQLATQLRQTWRSKLTSQQQQWEALVEQELNARVASFQQKIAPEYQDLMAELNLQDALADQVIKQVAEAPTKKVLDLFLR